MPHVDQSILEGVLDGLLSDASSDAVRVKLGNLHRTCKRIIEAGTVLTVPGVLTEYKTRFKNKAESLAESSLRNKRGGANLYNRLYCAWADYAKGTVFRKRQPGEAVTLDELGSILDLDLRARVSLTIAENHSLRSRLNILETMDQAQVIQIDGFTPSVKRKAAVATDAPDEDDLDELRDFLDARKMKARQLIETEDGAIVTERGHLIADPGFLFALRRVAKV